LDYFATNPVFRREDFDYAHTEGRTLAADTSQTVLKQHVKTGNLLHLRRGLYAVVPRGQTPDTVVVDPYVLASRMTADAVLASHTALQLHGRSYSISRRFTYLTRSRPTRFEFRGAEFVPLQIPKALRTLDDMGGGVQTRIRAGTTVRVTTLERTFVDVLHTPSRAGGWEEIWRSLESVEFFDLEAVIEYTLKLQSAVTAARVGFFLEQHREQLMVEDTSLGRLERLAPSSPTSMDRRRGERGRFFSRWNLVVPQSVVDRAWEEEA
ncbi:MAG: transcriptional regulator, partial [Lentisphaerae bacterium]|nr:transcriptional regulator [Lentisphaerota bacterium]